MKKIFISSDASSEIIENLKKYGYKAILLPKSRFLQEPVAAHADMLLHRVGDKLLCCEYYAKDDPTAFDNEKMLLTDETHCEKYPGDILFNCFEFQNRLYGKLDSLSEYVVKHYKEKGTKLVNIRQGYAKCSCIVTPKLCITDDENISNTVEERCIKIKKGSILLPGYNEGFIGGASFYDDDTVYFFGALHTHPDGEFIKDVLKQVNVDIVELAEGMLTDLGGAVL